MVQVQSVNYGNIRQTGGLADAVGKGRTRRAARKAAESKEARLGRLEQRTIAKDENVERRARAAEGRAVGEESRAIETAMGEAHARSTEEDKIKLAALVDYAEVLQPIPDNQRLGYVDARIRELRRQGQTDEEMEETLSIRALLADEKYEEASLLVDQTASLRPMIGEADDLKFTYGASYTVQNPGGSSSIITPRRDSAGNVDLVASPVTGKLTDQEGLTREDRLAMEGEAAFDKNISKQSSELSIKAFTDLSLMKRNNAKMKKVKGLLEDNIANGFVDISGPVESMLPSITEGAVNLDVLQKELGMDIIAGGSFGPLNESELVLALDIALPGKLSPPALLVWVNERIDAQEKLQSELSDMAVYLGTYGNTVPMWLTRHDEEGAAAKVEEVKPATRSSIMKFAGPEVVSKFMSKHRLSEPEAIKQMIKIANEKGGL